jgi:2-polyprenyl-6-methoxyphenol hydroxylase-like FAD-dependent oxidoreductase
VVRWGKEFVKYEHIDGGRVRAHFVDGSVAEGDVLIGADGANSRVRRQYLPHLRRLDLGVTNIAGRFPLTPENVSRVPGEILDSSVNNVVPRNPGWMFLSTWGTAPRPGTGAESNGSFVVWAYVGSKESYPEDPETMTPVQLRDFVLSRTEGWSPTLRMLVRESAVDTIGPVVLKSMEELPTWSSSNVTVLGDAIHNMTPMAGIGANTALRDAGVLRRVLLDAAAGTRDLVDCVEDYEYQMRSYANPAIAASTRNALNAASPARFPRRAFRTMLRVAEVVPPVKHKMFPASAGSK